MLRRRLRIAHVASAINSTRPTRDAAVMTPTERPLFSKKPLGAVAGSAAADTDAEEDEVAVVVVAVRDRPPVDAPVAGVVEEDVWVAELVGDVDVREVDVDDTDEDEEVVVEAAEEDVDCAVDEGCEVVAAEEVAADELVSVMVELDDDVDWPPKPGRLIDGSGGKLRVGKPPSGLLSVAVASPPPRIPFATPPRRPRSENSVSCL